MDDKELVNFVLSFAGEMNALQRRYAPLLESARGRGGTAAVFTAYRAEAGMLYGRYLTPRERCCCMSIASPPVYAAVEGLTLSTVERRNSRAVVELLTSEGRLDFQFNLMCKNGEWRINSFKQRLHSERRIYRWVYGDF
ncbi:MAG: hypothetical protein HFG01_07630 [Oscillibacter sp.]|jgi:hypothetical protein|nr:hypothetical protein [Oscillibacter sp.]